jgi:hypothetical protein
MKGIDHLVLCGRDLEAMRARYKEMGFTLTPRAEHPFGTGNSLVQLYPDSLKMREMACGEASFGFDWRA